LNYTRKCPVFNSVHPVLTEPNSPYR